jgi:hypothetical protein
LVDSKLLLNQIAEVHCLLNGKTMDGRPARKLDFRIARYAIILLAATTLENFMDKTLKIKDIPFFNLYRLEMVAQNLHLEYDRTKQARKMYEGLEKKGEIKREITAENKTYITLTEKGTKSCLKKLEELQTLRGYLTKIPSLQDKYAGQDESRKDLRSKSQGLTETEVRVEELIARISSLD